MHLNLVCGPFGRTPGRLEAVELSGLCSAPESFAVGRVPRPARRLGRGIRRSGFGARDVLPQVCDCGFAQPPESPWSEAFHGWILGSQKFVDRVRALVQGQPERELNCCEARQVRALTISRVSEVVVKYGIDELEISPRGSRHPARAAMAYLARRHTVATNSDLVLIWASGALRACQT